MLVKMPGRDGGMIFVIEPMPPTMWVIPEYQMCRVVAWGASADRVPRLVVKLRLEDVAQVNPQGSWHHESVMWYGCVRVVLVPAHSPTPR